MAKKEPKVDYETLEGLVSIQCEIEEVAAVLKLSVAQVKKLAANDPEFKRIWESGPGLGRASLRRLQWRHARGFGPSAVAMAIHLGKQWLGQSDRSKVEIDQTVRIEGVNSAADLLLKGINVDRLEKREGVELLKLCETIDESGGLHMLSPPKRDRFFALLGKATPFEEQQDDVDRAEPIALLPPPENKQGTE